MVQTCSNHLPSAFLVKGKRHLGDAISRNAVRYHDDANGRISQFATPRIGCLAGTLPLAISPLPERTMKESNAESPKDELSLAVHFPGWN